MDSTHIDTVVIGAGAAGLHVARLLGRRGAEHLVIDAADRVGDSWRERYRSLRLFTPRRLAELPGLRLGIRFFEFPTASQLADYLERYADETRVPLRLSTRVERLTHAAGRFRLELSSGEPISASRVVVAAGAHRMPVTPSFAAQLDPSIHRLHSLDYRGPEDLAPGPVLVVGAANSGTDIALESAASGHATTLAGRHPGQVPIDIDHPVGNLLSGVFLRRLGSLTLDTERGRRAFAEQHGHGVNLVRNKVAHLDKAGVRRTGRIAGVESGLPLTDDGETVPASTVVWCTGSTPDLRWIDIPAAFGADGSVAHRRGIATGVAGLAFMGLPFQYAPTSGTLMGMGRDAEHVVLRLCEPSDARSGAASVAAA
ncbi:flavin-containing monooxygenase [Microbacterium sp. CPCC 204701]|uniref:flavin-containing monooxygenase n=1 Tax=Microbacterium sp. CPCC 204701 TaxID=2493084 RepID=UPI0013E35AB5|nr:NAD(P)/FAD-dependent oxidoreductase [Microbacterium sp. CPCC 204701]